VVSTTTTTTTVVTSTSEANTTTTSEDSNVVTTVEEAEAILRELWFGWFEGIYNQDEDRIKQVVGTQAMLDAAGAQFGVMEFAAAPDPALILLSDLEILRADQICLALWAGVSASFRPGATEGVQILRWASDRWIFAGFWTHRDDLWEADCDSQLDASF
jgi:hypothetical protein